MKNIKFILIAFLLSAALFSCSKVDTAPEATKPGEIVEATVIADLSVADINGLVVAMQLSGQVTINNGAKLVKIIYLTTDANNAVVKASGVVCIPKVSGAFPIFSFQHGTQTVRNVVASVKGVLSTEGLIGAVGAANGFVSCIPDYIGLGVSTTLHPYLNVKASASVVIDLMRACRSYCASNTITLKNQVFLGGYSEGGYVTMAAQKTIEQNLSAEFTIVATAPCAGPYDLNGTLDAIFATNIYNEPTNLGYILMAYNDVYKFTTIDKIFNPSYSSVMAGLYDGTKTSDQINAAMSTDISKLLTTDFVNTYVKTSTNAFRTALIDNSLINWKPVSLTRLYHGDADVTVPYQNSVTALNSFVNLGATKVELKTIAGGTHQTAAIPVVMDFIKWFITLK